MNAQQRRELGELVLRLLDEGVRPIDLDEEINDLVEIWNEGATGEGTDERRIAREARHQAAALAQLSLDERIKRRPKRRRRSYRGILFGALTIMLLVAPLAQARPFEAAEDGMYWLAVDYWGGKEPYNCKRVVRQVAAPQNMFFGYLGESDQPPRRPLPRRSREVCVTNIAETLLSDSYHFCVAVVHEMGHLRGFGHSGDPNSIMYPYLEGMSYLPACSDENRARYTPSLAEARNRTSEKQR